MVHILVVDDEPTIRRLLRLTLGPEYRIEEASDGTEALRKLLEEPPDIVLLDIAMPRMDGLEVCRICRAEPRLGGLGIVVVSAHADAGEALDAGADRYLRKPFRPVELLKTVEDVLAIRRFKSDDTRSDRAPIGE